VVHNGSERKNKVKYTCAECGQNAWAKPDASLICGVCKKWMLGADGGAA
jgi:hypothetical protein